MPGIGVIHNPRARQNVRRPDRIPRLAYILGETGVSSATGSLEALDAALDRFYERGIDVLAVNGGDGSNHVVLTHLIRRWGARPLPKIALLRGGTLNTVAQGIGLRGSPERILYRLQQRYAAGEPLATVQRTLINADGQYGFIFGNGLIAEFMSDYYREGEPSPLQGALTLWRGVVSAVSGGERTKRWFAPVEARVVVDGADFLPRRFAALMAGGVTEIGIGFAPFGRAVDRPGRFQLVAIHCRPFDVVGELPYLYFGRPWHPHKATEFLCSHVTVEAARPFPFTLDGDMHACDGRLSLSAGPTIDLVV